MEKKYYYSEKENTGTIGNNIIKLISLSILFGSYKCRLSCSFLKNEDIGDLRLLCLTSPKIHKYQKRNIWKLFLPLRL